MKSFHRLGVLFMSSVKSGILFEQSRGSLVMAKMISKSRAPLSSAQTPKSRTPSAKPLSPLVMIGASMGGMKEFQELLPDLGSEFPFTVVLLQHLDPDSTGQLAKILSTSLGREVHELKDGQRLKPSEIYVLPNWAQATWMGGKVELTKRIHHATDDHFPIDRFLKSLSLDTKRPRLSILLSGSNSDGTLGLKRFKKSGGLSIVLSPEQSPFDFMPTHAIEAGAADAVMSLSQIKETLESFSVEALLNLKSKKNSLDAAVDTGFQDILKLLGQRTGVDFSQYKEATLK
ncbi:MAG: hypothetical protein EOP09_09390, partial [Proteobacteria bacterium]